MNNYQTGNIKLEKLAKENSAFQTCQPDMSDVNFEIGKSSSTVKIFAAIAAFALIYGIRFFLRRYVGNPNGSMSAGDIVFLVLYRLDNRPCSCDNGQGKE